MITKYGKKVAVWILTMMLGLSMVFFQSMAAYAANGLTPEGVNRKVGTRKGHNNSPMNIMEVEYGSNYNEFDGHTELYIMSDVTHHVYTIGSGESVTIQCSGELKDFRSAQVDGVQVEEGNYILQEGSTILTFVSKYLDTLSVGTHKVTLNYNYDSIDTELTILATAVTPVTDNISGTANGTSNIQGNVSNTVNGVYSSGNAGAVQTGDDTQIMFWALAVVAALGICVVLGFRKRRA